MYRNRGKQRDQRREENKPRRHGGTEKNEMKEGGNKSIAWLSQKILRASVPPWFLLLVSAFTLGCEQDMADQPRYEALEPSTFFDDGAASRHPPVGTVARGHLNADEHFSTGRVGGELATEFPQPVTAEILHRGQERYRIYCTPCHDQTGSGRGMVVQRGFPQPPSFHTDRLRQAPVGHFFDVISNGFGRMYDYSAQLSPDDRWAVVAYLRALQLSQYAPAEALPEEDVQKLNQSAKPAP